MDSANLDQVRKSLPIFGVRNKLISEIQRNATLVLLGETGCGKTTQIPQYIHEAQPQMKGLIGCTQPRRVAAITVAQRVAHETKTELGTLVDMTTIETKIKYMTDGMLLREAIADPLLSRYAVIILDEVHERTIHTDVLLGVVKAAQQARRSNSTVASTPPVAVKNVTNGAAMTGSKAHLKPLKVIVMSATMDVDEFSLYFGKAPVFYLEGRLHPVEVYHTAEKQTDYVHSALTCVFQIHTSHAVDDGDILVFMTGQEEIDAMVRTLIQFSRASAASMPPMLVLPLYAALPSPRQLKVFDKAPQGHRKVIVSTNIAETSITIRGIRFVVDTGMIKGKLYTAASKLETLRVHKISRSQAWQRTGRAGRESPGICYRLYTEAEYEQMQLNTVPEILRSNLASVVLHLLALGVTDLINFDFMSKPSVDALSAALDELELLGAVRPKHNNTGKENGLSNGSSNGHHIEEPTSKKPKLDGQDDYVLTDIGTKMVQFPLDPKLARTILAADKLNCVDEVVKIVSMLSVDSVYLNDAAKREHISALRQKFNSADGDHITLLNVYKAYVANKTVKEWCHENYLDQKNLKLAVEIYQQLKEICTRNNIKMSSSNNTVNIRMALISGLFVNAAEFYKENEYKTIANRQIVYIHPSSVLFNSKPACVLFNELIQTNKTYMRDLSVISANWLSEANPSYFRSKLNNNLDINHVNFNANKIR